ncbi:DUF6338 family protein [Cellulomonas pakistanensis]|uniref:Uncharacterized protein n=1 Tax=Cellulomonas pakistanensis TaxID=992287 RepID=A0A919U4J6_9CELL|nr:DUF6338 family protein [Cellulomonas pakistanensis]GIG37556.1 hypothetical protein Cpa01nite_29370 [Cellulomonas pakistanensis]
MPETWAKAAVVLTLVVPGFVYRASWQSVAGPDPARPDFGTRVLHAIVATATFAGVYGTVLGPALLAVARDPELAVEGARTAAVAFLLLAIGIPWAAARICLALARSRPYRRLVARSLTALRLHPPRPAPSAWDYAFRRVRSGWVRVRFSDGQWLGGCYGDHSFVSAYPDPQELYVEEGWVVRADGSFTDRLHSPGGMLIDCTAAIAIDFVPADRDTRGGAHDDTNGEL